MRTLTIFIVIIPLLSCKSENEVIYQIMSKSIGREVTLPDSLEYRSLNDSLCTPPDSPMKIIVYINGECQVCIEQFSKWAKVDMKDLGASNQVSVLFYVRAYDFGAVEKHLQRTGFTHPVFIDSRSDILFKNDIPENTPLLHTFLIDQDNKIVLIGSPTSNQKIWDLCKQQIQRLSK